MNFVHQTEYLKLLKLIMHKMKKLLQLVLSSILVFTFCGLNGQPWELHRETENEQRLRAISFPDSIHGWMVGNKPGENRAYIIHTDDGGDTWSEQVSPESDQLQDVHFMDENTGFALGVESIIKTVNGGMEWTVVTLDSDSVNLMLTDFDFTGLTAYAVGDNGTLLKSLDGGDHWEALPMLPSYAFYLAVDFVNPDTGIVAGGKGTGHFAMRTVDGGHTWDSLSIETSEGTSDGSFLDVSFVEESTVYMAGRLGKVVSSVDYGNTWQEKTQISIPGGSLLESTALYFHDADTGWVASNLMSAQAAFIHRTNDGGDTWREELFFTQSPNVGLQDVTFTESGTGWACGLQSGLTLNGEVIFRGTGTDHTSIEPHSPVPSGISGFITHPNPFNISTEISFSLKESSDIKLVIYNAFGQIMDQMYDGLLPRGAHSFSLQAGSLPEGIYFSVLYLDGASIARKMVLSR